MSDARATAGEAADPRTSAERLSQLAADPQLHLVIAANPGAHDGLVEWIRDHGDPQASAEAQRRLSRQSPVDPFASPEPASTPEPAGAPETPVTPVPAPDTVVTPAADAEAPRVEPAPEPVASPADARRKTGPETHEPASVPRPVVWIATGLVIGLLVGAAISTALILWVLPGLFGGAR